MKSTDINHRILNVMIGVILILCFTEWIPFINTACRVVGIIIASIMFLVSYPERPKRR